MRNMHMTEHKHAFLMTGLVFLLFLLTTCAPKAGTITGGANPTATQPPVQRCGTVHAMRQQVMPNDQKSAKGVEDCFWQAYQQCHPATLVYSQGSIDTVTIHTFSLTSQNGKCS